MTTLTEDIKDVFFRVYLGTIRIEDFESWLYESKELKQLLPEETYFDFLSFNFNQRSVKYELTKLLDQHIDHGEYETWKLNNLLDQVDQKVGDYPKAIIKFYDLYCKGYGFLDKLAFAYGLALDCPWGKYGLHSYDQLSQSQKNELVDSFYPEIKSEIKRVKNWLEDAKIKLTGEKNDLGHFEFVDLRTERDQ